MLSWRGNVVCSPPSGPPILLCDGNIWRLLPTVSPQTYVLIRYKFPICVFVYHFPVGCTDHWYTSAKPWATLGKATLVLYMSYVFWNLKESPSQCTNHDGSRTRNPATSCTAASLLQMLEWRIWLMVKTKQATLKLRIGRYRPVRNRVPGYSQSQTILLDETPYPSKIINPIKLLPSRSEA